RRYDWRRGESRGAQGAVDGGVPRRDRGRRRGSNRRRRPLPGRPDGVALQRAVPARPAPSGLRRTGPAARGRVDPRAPHPNERNPMSTTTDLRARIDEVIKTEPVALFMKGNPEFIMCGNSDRALRALRGAGAPVSAVDILPDPAIRQELSALSGWPTIPQ